MPSVMPPSPGLEAIILCGPGVSLNTFTSSPSEFPKALVPIANRPMVWYPLDWCYRMAVTKITLITAPESQAALQTALQTHPALTSLPNPRPEILAPEGLSMTTGTGELLRLEEVRAAIETDFVVLPCDLVSEIDGSKLVEQWLSLNPLKFSESSSDRSGGLGVFYPTYGWEGISHKKDETDFLATVSISAPKVPPPATSLRGNIEQIVMTMPTDTLSDKTEAGAGHLRLRQSLLSKHGRVKLKMKHRDAHVYIFPRWVLDFAAENETFDSISEDLMGCWAKAGWQTRLADRLGLDGVFRNANGGPKDDDSTTQSLLTPSYLSTTNTNLPSQHTDSDASAPRISSASSPKFTSPPLQTPPLHVYIHPQASSHLVRRIDTAHALLDVSLYLAKTTVWPTHPLAHEHRIHPTTTLEPQARVSEADSLVGENVRLGSRCSIRESIIGANCEIGCNARLVRCLLMDGATVGHGCVLTGCIVGPRARIEAPARVCSGEPGKKKVAWEDDMEKTQLTNCEVAPYFVVDAGTEATGEKFMGFDTSEDKSETDEVEDEAQA